MQSAKSVQPGTSAGWEGYDHRAELGVNPRRSLVPLSIRPEATVGRLVSIGSSNAARLLAPAILLVVWQVTAGLGLIDKRILDTPVAVVMALWELARSGVLLESLIASAQRSASGFIIGGATGLTLGLIGGLSNLGEKALDALMQMLRMVPFLALIPLFIVWFGVGEQPKITLIAVACTFPVYMNTFAGVRNVDAKVVEAARVFGLSRLQIATQIVLPLAMPTILIGIRWAMGTSLLALVAAEQINARSGIGYLALNPRAALRTDIVLAIILLYAFLGLFVDFTIRTIQRVALPWHRTIVGEPTR
ncbi:ABC transporter permease subunit [Mesorhizobium sp. CAU 1732]|uniref:ABC transporter permease n=1 Tax=Mesorhizobium sp. CAU 1732 TaxID=3140358 RepID=UPI00326010DB